MGVIMAISDRTIARCAKSMVDTCNLKKGEGVIIKGGAHTQRLLEDIAIECYRKGTTPTIVVTSDRYLPKVFERVPPKTARNGSTRDGRRTGPRRDSGSHTASSRRPS